MTARILVVDDVASNLRLLEANLIACYYEVRTASTGEAALLIASEWQPDIVLLDVMMPELDGYDVCRALKAERQTSHIPVVMVTALRSAPDRLRGLSCGADEFLTKPIEVGILQARLRSIMRLKRVTDEWRTRGLAARALGLESLDPSGTGRIRGRALIVDELPHRSRRVGAVLSRLGIEPMVVTETNASGLWAPPHAGPGVAADTRDDEFDLVVIALSSQPGEELRLIGRLRAAEATRDVPILLLAESDARQETIAGLDLGASDTLLLPLDEDELAIRATNQVRRKTMQDKLRSSIDNAMVLAVTDHLTGLYNRRYLLGYLGGLFADARRSPFGLCLIDVDHFKQINDGRGHAVGDRALASIAQVLRESLREVDLVARYGGEEFVVVSADATADHLGEMAERLRGAVELTAFEDGLRVTVSIGLAMSTGTSSSRELLDHADQALYAAKRGGRNRVLRFGATGSSEVADFRRAAAS